MYAGHLAIDWENVSIVHVCQFYLEECPSNCIVIMKSLFEGRYVCKLVKSMLLKFMCLACVSS